jgi:hypothetical protein
MKCPDSECGLETTRTDADHEFETSIESEELNGNEVTLQIHTKVTFNCPSCGEELENHDGSPTAFDGESNCDIPVMEC